MPYFLVMKLVYLNNINLDNNFGEYDPETIIFIELLAWHINLKNENHLKKS